MGIEDKKEFSHPDPTVDQRYRSFEISSDKLTRGECAEDQLNDLARAALPDRFRSLIDCSEVQSVQRAEHYNKQLAGVHLGHRGVEQRAAADRGHYNVVELKLGQDLSAGCVHGVDKRDASTPHFGHWFGEYAPVGRTQASVREEFVLPMSSSDKTHATFGKIAAGSTVVISEIGPRSYTLKDIDMSGGPWASAKDSRGRLYETPPRDTPPLGEVPPLKAFQFELREDPQKAFKPDVVSGKSKWDPKDHELTRDVWH